MKKQLIKKTEKEIIASVFKDCSKKELIEAILNLRETVEIYIRELQLVKKHYENNKKK